MQLHDARDYSPVAIHPLNGWTEQLTLINGLELI